MNLPKKYVPTEAQRQLCFDIIKELNKKEWTLSLYKAMNGSHYNDPEAIDLNTIENAVYMFMKNDVSFVIANAMNLYEHQSSFNPNMPMRFLIYAGMLYDKYIENSESYYLYSTAQQKAPRRSVFVSITEPRKWKTE